MTRRQVRLKLQIELELSHLIGVKGMIIETEIIGVETVIDGRRRESLID